MDPIVKVLLIEIDESLEEVIDKFDQLLDELGGDTDE